MDIDISHSLRRSKRIAEKTQKIKNEDYINHIYTLHDVSGDLLDMTDTLESDNLRKIISEYESIIGYLLDVKS